MNLPLHKPLLYLITNRRDFLRQTDSDAAASRLQIEIIRQAAAAGCQLIQIRERDLSAKALADFTRRAIAAARPFGAKVLVNDRLDVALATQADGVHLRVNSLPALEIRRIIQQKGLQEFLIAASTHSLAEAKAAAEAEADFIVSGPVFDTPSKREFGAPLGLESFAEICHGISIPTLALGGINLANYRRPLECGAVGLAAIGLFNKTETISSTIQTLLDPISS